MLEDKASVEPMGVDDFDEDTAGVALTATSLVLGPLWELLTEPIPMEEAFNDVADTVVTGGLLVDALFAPSTEAEEVELDEVVDSAVGRRMMEGSPLVEPTIALPFSDGNWSEELGADELSTVLLGEVTEELDPSILGYDVERTVG
ncbi:hypothetical protein LTR28_004687 [Elasticomyces elasticus]|nr:hypothetical protein LTR28_004687 [Elasticomyces elasticus]